MVLAYLEHGVSDAVEASHVQVLQQGQLGEGRQLGLLQGGGRQQLQPAAREPRLRSDHERLAPPPLPCWYALRAADMSQ